MKDHHNMVMKFPKTKGKGFSVWVNDEKSDCEEGKRLHLWPS